MTHRYLFPILMASMITSCGNATRVDQRPQPQPQPQPPPPDWRYLLCCDPPFPLDGYVASSETPVVVNVCLGTETLSSTEVRPGAPLELPSTKLGGGKPVQLQFFAGTGKQGCVDRATLLKAPRDGNKMAITLTRDRWSGVLTPNDKCAGCTCPVCPDPTVGKR
jgi:hypothetical protein